LKKRDTSCNLVTTLAKRAGERRPARPARGLLHGALPIGRNEHFRVLPPEELSPFVAHFWSVSWALQSPFTAETLPHPSAHLVFEEHGGEWRAEVAGVHTARFSKRLVGEGRVFGIKFRPAMLQPFACASMATLTDRVVPIDAIFGAPGEALARAIRLEADFDARMDLMRAFLVRRIPSVQTEVACVRDLVERLAVDRALLRVEDVADAAGLDVRALQRSFRRHVGVSPKWVIQRYRLHEAAEQLRTEPSMSLAILAASLGYADQAHFSRDFRRMVGRTPRGFAQRTAPVITRNTRRCESRPLPK
jgi:AraC-like DNA-binding protein